MQRQIASLFNPKEKKGHACYNIWLKNLILAVFKMSCQWDGQDFDWKTYYSSQLGGPDYLKSSIMSKSVEKNNNNLRVKNWRKAHTYFTNENAYL